MQNAERLQAVASGTAFALGVEGLTRLVRAVSRDYKRRKVERVRREIEAEIALLEQRRAVDLADGQKSDEPARKPRR